MIQKNVHVHISTISNSHRVVIVMLSTLRASPFEALNIFRKFYRGARAVRGVLNLHQHISAKHSEFVSRYSWYLKAPKVSYVYNTFSSLVWTRSRAVTLKTCTDVRTRTQTVRNRSFHIGLQHPPYDNYTTELNTPGGRESRDTKSWVSSKQDQAHQSRV